MVSLKSLDDEYYNESIAAVTDWCSTAYSDNFMKLPPEIFQSLQSTHTTVNRSVSAD